MVTDNPIGVIINSPRFDWHITNLRNYISLRPLNVEPVKLDTLALQPLGQGSGMVGLPGDFTPPSRFVRAAFSAPAVPTANAADGVLQAVHILNDFDTPVGIVKDKEGKQVGYDNTLTTVARDPQALRYYWRTYEDQTIPHGGHEGPHDPEHTGQDADHGPAQDPAHRRYDQADAALSRAGLRAPVRPRAPPPRCRRCGAFPSPAPRLAVCAANGYHCLLVTDPRRQEPR